VDICLILDVITDHSAKVILCSCNLIFDVFEESIKSLNMFRSKGLINYVLVLFKVIIKDAVFQ